MPGGRIWYRSNGDRFTDRPALVGVHGGPGVPHDYLLPLTALSGERRIILYDQLDVGKSDKPSDPKNWTVERFVAEIDALRKALGLEPMHLFGNSWGGTIAAEYAHRPAAGPHQPRPCPGRCSAPPAGSPTMTTISARSPQERRMRWRVRAAAAPMHDPKVAMAVAEYNRRHLCRADPWPDFLERAMNGTNTTVYNTMWGPTEFICTGTLQRYDCTRRLSHIQAPTLVICGQHDESAPHRSARRSADDPRRAARRSFPMHLASALHRAAGSLHGDPPDLPERVRVGRCLIRSSSWRKPKSSMISNVQIDKLAGGYLNQVFRVRGQEGGDDADWVHQGLHARDRACAVPNLPEERAARQPIWPARSGARRHLFSYFEMTDGPVLVYEYCEGEIWQRGVGDVGLLLRDLRALDTTDYSFRDVPSPARRDSGGGRGVPAKDPLGDALAPRRGAPEADRDRSVSRSFLHTDIGPGNIIVAKDDGRLVVIDWQCPAVGDPVQDVIAFLSPAFQILWAGVPLTTDEEGGVLRGL